jgi:hypothetical protein
VEEVGLLERVAGEADAGLRLQEEVDEDVDRDQRDRDDRRAIGRQVVLQREQGPARLPAERPRQARCVLRRRG